MLNFTEFLSDSNISEEEKKLVKETRQAFLEFNRRQPLLIGDEPVLSDSDADLEGPEVVKEIKSLVSEEGKNGSG